jgi:GntP family gluconate:H+ symporter
MVMSGSIIAPLAAAAGLHSALQSTLVVMAIGGGAMTVSHGNDAYFWVVSRFGNVSSSDAFRWYTPMTLLQGLTVLTITLILSVLL